MKQSRIQEVHNTIVSAGRMESMPTIMGGRGKREETEGAILNTMYGRKIQECKKRNVFKEWVDENAAERPMIVEQITKQVCCVRYREKNNESLPNPIGRTGTVKWKQRTRKCSHQNHLLVSTPPAVLFLLSCPDIGVCRWQLHRLHFFCCRWLTRTSIVVLNNINGPHLPHWSFPSSRGSCD
jgi:hypothetical protein